MHFIYFLLQYLKILIFIQILFENFATCTLIASSVFCKIWEYHKKILAFNLLVWWECYISIQFHYFYTANETLCKNYEEDCTLL